MKFADIIDSKGILRTSRVDMAQRDVEVGLDSLNMLDDVMVVFEQAF